MTMKRKIVIGFYLSGIAASVLIGLQWIRYYTTPLTSRHTFPLHEVLKPSGTIGHALGIVGTLLMAMTLLYSLRKKYEFKEHLGPLRNWLEFHMFAGVVGPILILWHSTFKFNGIIATTSFVVMVIVVISGIIGRYLYGQIPYRLNGFEMDILELKKMDVELDEKLKEHLVNYESILDDFNRIFPDDVDGKNSTLKLFLYLLKTNHQRKRFYTMYRKKISQSSATDQHLLPDILQLLQKKTELNRKMAIYDISKKLLNSWRFLHKKLSWLLLITAVLHITVTIILGFRWVF